jgi:hypothetical protein
VVFSDEVTRQLILQRFALDTVVFSDFIGQTHRGHISSTISATPIRSTITAARAVSTIRGDRITSEVS